MKLFPSLFRSRRAKRSADAAQAAGFVIYTSPGCECSQETIALLRHNGVEPRVEDLADHPQIRHEHGAATPLVQIDGRVRFFGKVEPVLLKRFLHHR